MLQVTKSLDLLLPKDCVRSFVASRLDVPIIKTNNIQVTFKRT